VSGGVEVKVWGLKLWYEKNMALGNRAVAVALDISNAHNTFDREASIEALNSFADAYGSLRSLPRAWHALTFQKDPIFVRDIDSANGWSYLCESAAGDGQGNPLTSIAFVATIDASLKGTEAKFKVEIRAIQDDMTMMGEPEQIFGPGKALESLLELLAKVNLSPNRVKFQCIGTTDHAPDNALDWLVFDEKTGERRGGIALRNPETGEVVLNEETGLSEKIYGAQVCGTPVGSGSFERSWLAAKADEICSSIYKTTKLLSFRSARAAHSVTYYSSLSLADFLAATNRPSQTAFFRAKIDVAYTRRVRDRGGRGRPRP
jgi:hypothetical protein